jgi:hypothetical protein
MTYYIISIMEAISIDALAYITPVKPPKVKRRMKATLNYIVNCI